jgi:integrase
MGRDKPTKVEGTPRGLGLYRRQGREGFFFIKNLSHVAKKHPGAFERNGQFDEWIKRPDGSLVGSLSEAKAYCQRRSGELDELKLALRRPHTSYSGEDLQAIGHALADHWIRSYQRGRNLQRLDLDYWRLLNRELGEAENLRTNKPDVVAFVLMEGNEVPNAPWTVCPIDRVIEEERKIKRLCLNQGFNPDEQGLKTIMLVFRKRVGEHIDMVSVAKNEGIAAPPPPTIQQRGKTWKALIEAKEKEGMAAGTLKGVTKAVERLHGWLATAYKIKLPTGLEPELALEYRDFLFTQSGLKPSTASKELRYLQGVFNASVKQGILGTNPFQNLPRDRSAALRTKMDQVKTFDDERCIDPVSAQEICSTMQKNRRGETDPSFDVFFLQAMTGARIQEVAGLRRCDFIERKSGNMTFKCIRIIHWEGRGLGALGSRGGLKTVQSQRIIPLPERAHEIWMRYSDPSKREPAFPQEMPKKESQNWGDNLKRRMKDKCKNYPGTHGWRRSLINNAINHGLPNRVVEMVTGKTGSSSLNDYASDDLSLMLKAVELNAKVLGIYPGKRAKE